MNNGLLLSTAWRGFGHTNSYNYGGHIDAGTGFLHGIGHMIFSAALYSTVFRVLRHIPLPIMLAVLAVVIYLLWRRAKRTGQNPF